MTQFKNPMEIFKLLDKSNCRKCTEATCLAFAAAVFKGQKRIDECPHLTSDILERYRGRCASRPAFEQNVDDALGHLKIKISTIDLSAAARRLGATFADEKLTIKILGKDFSVDNKGNLSADIHINAWVVVPFLNYVLYGKGLPVSRNWVSFRELKDGKERYPLFQKRCEEPMKRVADIYPNLFNDVVHLFSGKRVEKQFESDISVVLQPLPRVPIMMCYWLPEDDLASSLNVFFDETVDQNLDIGSIFTLGAGLAQMFGKIALRHGFPEAISSD